MKKIKVIIIEDDKFLNKLYVNKLQANNFDASGTLTAQEGLHRINSAKPDLILLDLILPCKNGFEVLKEIKLNPKTKDIPVIILSNLCQELDIKKTLELGAIAYFVKTDFSINELPKLIEDALNKSKK